MMRMWRKVAKLLVIKNRTEAYAVIYALGLGATGRGVQFLTDYPGVPGYLLALASTTAVFMAGAKILDATQPRWRGTERRAAGRCDRRQMVRTLD
jgi:hypothetical protein